MTDHVAVNSSKLALGATTADGCGRGRPRSDDNVGKLALTKLRNKQPTCLDNLRRDLDVAAFAGLRLGGL